MMPPERQPDLPESPDAWMISDVFGTPVAPGPMYLRARQYAADALERPHDQHAANMARMMLREHFELLFHIWGDEDEDDGEAFVIEAMLVMLKDAARPRDLS